jgi:hypothetical protein
LQHVIVDAVVAAQHQRGGQPEQFLGARVQRSVGVSLRIQTEETLDAEVINGKDAFVHAGTVGFKFIQAGAHVNLL